jgi:hypothetical protein
MYGDEGRKLRDSRAVKVVLVIIVIILMLAIFLRIAMQPSLQSDSSAPRNQHWDTVITEGEG